jgi:hypothetical protein
MTTAILKDPQNKPQAQPGVPITFKIVAYLVKVEDNKTRRNMSGRQAHAKYDSGINMISKHASETGNPHFRHGSVILILRIGF